MAGIIYSSDGTLTYETACRLCRNSAIIDKIPAAHYAAWRKGAKPEEAFTTLSARERESLLTSICVACLAHIPTVED